MSDEDESQESSYMALPAFGRPAHPPQAPAARAAKRPVACKPGTNNALSGHVTGIVLDIILHLHTRGTCYRHSL